MTGMWHAVLIVLSQTIYTWTDSRGTVHYTDDPTTIPANVKAKTTDGDELSHTGPTPKLERAPEPERAPPSTLSAAQGGTSDEDYWRKEFRAARDKVRTLEDELAADTRKYDDPSRLPMSGTYYCSPGFYAPGFVGPGFVGPGFVGPGSFGPGYRSFSRSQVGFGASLNVPLGTAGSLNVNAGATQAVNRGNTTVAPFAGYPGTIGFGYGGPCWYQMDGQYAYVRDRMDKTKAALARAKEDLADLERRAANAAVPLEWRR
jgi:hypothetical protein